jgi:hypothetical protein
MKEIHTEIEINARADKVWRVLTCVLPSSRETRFVSRFRCASPESDTLVPQR